MPSTIILRKNRLPKNPLLYNYTSLPRTAVAKVDTGDSLLVPVLASYLLLTELVTSYNYIF